MNLNYPWQLYHWHFELSSKCAIACPRCPRTEMPNTPWLQKEISLIDFKNILNEEILLNHVKRLTFCGDVGDPIYARDFLKIIEYVKAINPKIHIYTITNGSYKTQQWWYNFAKLSNEYDTINFSIDGFDNESNNKYRVNSNWDSIINGVKIMSSESAAHVYWAAIVFKFNQNKLDLIKELAKNYGCDGLQLTYSTKFGSKYGEAYGGQADDLEPSEQYISKTHRYERYFFPLSNRTQNNKDYLHHNANLYESVKQKYNNFITPMCIIGNRGLFVNAEQTMFPCSWTSFPYEKLGTERKSIDFKDSFFSTYRDQLNIKKHGLNNVLNNPIWDKFFNSLNSSSCAWVECEQKCNKNLVDFDYAVGYLTN